MCIHEIVLSVVSVWHGEGIIGNVGEINVCGRYNMNNEFEFSISMECVRFL